EFQGTRTAPEGFAALNPAFDVTPHRYVTAVITERGMITKPFGRKIRELFHPPAV
ncbi:MAG: hypothetical protein JXI32_06005, partial [Deltaproteobacteria bacterium]|nr:hypothetical protein [Deltaproteobacteria bacterium]